MIEAIADLGKYERHKNPNLSPFDIWLQDSFDEGNYGHLLLVVFEKENDKWRYKEVDYRQNGADLKSRLLYKRSGPRGCDKTPTAKVAKSIAVTFNQKIKGWFEAYGQSAYLEKHEKDFLLKILDAMKEEEIRILSDLEVKAKQLENKGIVLSVQFVEDDRSTLIGDYPFFGCFITEESKEGYKYSKTFKKSSFSKNAVCSVCKKTKEEVFGYFTTLKFYNVDKPGMVTGGFRQDQSWKNYPVCLDCALDIEMGITTMEESLDFSLYGFKYYLIPKIMNDSSKSEIISDIQSMKKSIKINNKDRPSITGAEEELFDLLKDEDNHASFSLIFYEKPQKEVFRILANIEEVLPSRLRKLFDVKADVDNLVFIKTPEKDGKRIFSFHFGAIRNFFPNDKTHGNHNKPFLQIVNNIFCSESIDYHYVLSRVMQRIREAYISKEVNPWYQAILSFTLLFYLDKLGILTINNGDPKTMDQSFYQSYVITSSDEFEEKATLFFDNFHDFFRTDVQKSIFLLGVLTKFLLNIQSVERNSTPFWSKLKGLKMDSRDMVGLLPVIVEKLEQYHANYYKHMETLIAKHLISSGDHTRWNVPVDEMNYIFVLGMNLSEYFKIKKP
ncbi:MAG: TIGR02556 family CRISPR-associated protein [Desulfobacteraceae bacterium]|jgi:CRISPR-associated protein Csh1